MSQQQVYVDKALLAALDCDEFDLVANRQGYLSQRQQEGQTHRKAQSNRNIRYVFVAIAVILLVAYAQISRLSPAERETAARPLMVLIVIGGIGAAVALLLRWLDPQTETVPERVEQTSGVIKKRSLERGTSHTFHHEDQIVVNDLAFTVPLNAFEQFVDKHPYRIYYLRNGKRLLSAEPLAPLADESRAF